jgi:hypothetical protein
MKTSKLSVLLSVVFVALLAQGLLAPQVAMADDASKMAEKLRLEEELKKLAQRNAWAGVERKYLELIKLKVDLPVQDHDIGAQSAGYLGKTFEVYKRLQRAKQIVDRQDINDSLSVIDANYGRVDIQGHEKRRPELLREVMPFAPDQRKSIEWAQTVIKNTGSFNGMLPAGTYKVCTQEFTVAAGPDFLAVKLKKFSAKELKQCGSEEAVISTIEYSGPVAHFGFNFMSTPQPFNGLQFGDLADSGDFFGAQPQSFSGGGFTIGGGYELGFSSLAGIAAEISYSNMLDGKSAQSGQSAVFHGFHGWLASTIRPGDVRIAFGPVVSLFRSNGAGVAAWYDIEQDPEAHPPLDQKWKGYSTSGGAQVTFGYGLTDFGKMQGVVELGVNWSTDGTRHYINTGLRVGIVPLIERFKQ